MVHTWLGLTLGLLMVAGCLSRGDAPTTAVQTRLAYVGLDGQIYTTPLEGGDPRRVSVLADEPAAAAGERFARWPTWAHDGARLAFMRFDVSETPPDKASVFVVAADGSNLTKVFESDDELPIYMAWAPDSSSLTLLSQRAQQLRLQSIDPSRAGPPREIITGGPIYFAWSPDGQRLLLHVNGDRRASEHAVLAVVGADTTGQAVDVVSAQPADFRAPAWSGDGARMAFAAQAPGGQAALSVQPAGGSDWTRLTTVGTEPAFLWSPTSDRLAFSSRVSERIPLYGGIETIKADGSDRQRVTEANVVAFFWSPDGKKLAYAGLDPEARVLAWSVSDPDGKNRRELASFVPSDDQFFMFRFFDQYAQSHAIWSPDGKHLLYAGIRGDAARAKPPSEEASSASREAEREPAQIFVVATDGSSPPRVLVDGSIGFWPVPPSGRR